MAIHADSDVSIKLQMEHTAEGDLLLHYSQRLDSDTTPRLWKQTVHAVNEYDPQRIIVKAHDIDYCDGVGLGLLFQLEILAAERDLKIDIQGLKEEISSQLKMFEPSKFYHGEKIKRKPINIAVEVGYATVEIWDDIHGLIEYIGRVFTSLFSAIIRPWQLRWKDVFHVAEHAGADAVGIIILIGFLFGLIIAFSSAMPLRQFGAEIYVADLVAIALVRVLGPFITAIILAGRTGSSFAAEIGTMKINDEINAIRMMGLDAVRFLVTPKVIATIFITPLLTILTNLAGLVGSAVVILSLGFPLITYTQHVQNAIDANDVILGLFKSLVFGALVSAVGCLRGLQTKAGPSAVGISTTRAVVSGIVLIVITEGIFAVLFHYMGI